MAKQSENTAWRRRLHPKLQMIFNGDDPVNAVRAEVSSCLRVNQKIPARATPALATAVTPEKALKEHREETKIKDLSAKRGKVDVSVFVETRGQSLKKKSNVKRMNIRGHQGQLAMVDLSVDALQNLADDPMIAYIEPAENLKFPRPIKLDTHSKESPEAPRPPKVELANRHRRAADVLIGIIDVDGFDFTHPDFLDADGKSRFIRVWDQGGSLKVTPGRKPPKRKDGRFDYGTLFTNEDFDRAISESKKIKVSPHDLEPQSQMVPGSHGTHVASIAAGKSGLCSNAKIAAVLVSLPPETPEQRRANSFYDSTRLIDAVEYLLDLADTSGEGGKPMPISINISLGTNGHAHDGSSMLDRWIDAWLAEPGRSICVAAGNAGQEKEETPGDLGYILGRIHTSGTVAAKGLTHDIEWVVAGDGVIDVSENEMEIWYEPQDLFSVQVKPPGGKWIGPIKPGEYLENYQLPSRTLLSVYNKRYHGANGNNYISIYLSPNMKPPVVGIEAGTWMVRLTGIEVRDGRFHGWIERDDPARTRDNKHYYPSYFSERSNVDSSSVSSLACGERVVSVANLDELRQQIHISSSQGPTRTGALKPDVAAKGTNVVAANGFGRKDDPWIGMTGTSMASPYVAGVVGLMLNVEPKLSAAQINGIIKATANPLPGKSYAWVNDAGFGVINASACVREAASANERHDLKDRIK